MVCEEVMPGVIACGPPRGVYHRAVMECWACKRRHRFVIRWDGAWYGTTEYGSCGDVWQDGYRRERPFRRGWREKAQADFRAMWDHAAPRHLYEAYVTADIQVATGGDDRWEQAATERGAALLAIHQHQKES